MAAPTFVDDQETVWNTTTTPKTTPTRTTTTGDVVCVAGGSADGATPLSTPTGNSQTYALAQSIVIASYCTAYAWTYTETAGANYGVTGSRTGTAFMWGINAVRFSGSDGVGASSKTNVASGAPTLNITTTQANSAIVVMVFDWTATDGASRVWRTVNGAAATELSYFRNTTDWAAYVAYHPDAGAIGTYAVGLSAPGAQKYSIIAVEIKGTTGGAAAIPPPLVMATRW